MSKYLFKRAFCFVKYFEVESDSMDKAYQEALESDGAHWYDKDREEGYVTNIELIDSTD